MSGLAKIDLKTDGYQTSLLVNGNELPAIRASLMLDARDIPRLTVELRGDSSFSGDGIVEIIRPGTSNHFLEMARIIREMDADKVEEGILNSMSWGDAEDRSIVGRTIDAIAELLETKASG